MAHVENSHEHYAAKVFSKLNPDGSPIRKRQYATLQRIIRLHYSVQSHPHIIPMLKVFDGEDHLSLIFEYFPNGDLFENIVRHGNYVGQDELVKKIFLQLLEAIEHCHRLGVYHRDIKPENILVSDYLQNIKLGGFNMVTSASQSNEFGCGTLFYMSPECFEPGSNSYYLCAPTDVWSAGVTLVNLSCGRNLWAKPSFEDPMYRAYRERGSDYLKSILPFSDELASILDMIFLEDPQLRIKLSELKTLIAQCPSFTTQNSYPYYKTT
ncbi:kinase-like domain-containing protein [Xylariales sp. PMI_506]|nr:kinase-like domain-containing protein [Xylariales sp. PMI_506]